MGHAAANLPAMAKAKNPGSLRQIDGLLAASVGEGGAWQALRDLREAMRGVKGPGRPRAAFVTALARNGKLEDGSDDPAVLVMGYRVDGDSDPEARN